MKNSVKLSTSVHILVLIALNPYDDLTSAAIAKSISTNAGYVRQLMSLLRKGEIISSTTGHAQPKLSRPAEEISLLDVYNAVEKDSPLLLINTNTNEACGVGIGIQLSLQEFYETIQKKAEEEMAKVSLQAVIDKYKAKIPKLMKELTEKGVELEPLGDAWINF